MSEDQQARQLLDGLDRPRSPRAAFDQALRNELFREQADGRSPARDREADVVIDLEPRTAEREARRKRRKPGQLIVAAAVIAILALGTLIAVTELGSDNNNVATRTGTETAQQTAAACARFDEKAFGTIGRQELLGPNRETAFRDRSKTQRAITELTAALAAFPAELRAAGISDPEVTRLLAQAHAASAAALDQLQRGLAIQVPRSKVAGIDVFLVDVQRRLIALGVAECL